MVTIHWEALDPACPNDEARKAVELIHEAGSKAAIALKPDTDVSVLAQTIGLWDMVLVMSVFPGFSGQSFIEETPNRIRQVVQLAKEAGVSPLIQVDGGINPTTAALVGVAGADVMVAGNGVFKAADRAAAIESIRLSAANAR
jgi:ribulose-phosphate 3-epimerase